MKKKFHILTACLALALSLSSSFAANPDSDNSTYIVGHWNYPANTVTPVYVVSDGDDVELFINDISNGRGRHESKYLFSFDDVIFQPGTLTAVSYDAEGKEKGRYSLVTSGVPAQLKLTVLDPSVAESNNSEDVVIQCETTDFYGRRCLNDNRMIYFEIEEPADRPSSLIREKNVRVKQIPLNKGENRITVKKQSKSGEIKVTAKTQGLASTSVTAKP